VRIPHRHFDGKTLTQIYDELYELADGIIKKYNPCKFSNGRCAGGIGCCNGCRYLFSTGCSVKALACKLWICWNLEGTLPECEHELKELSEIAAQYGFLDLCDSRIGRRESKGEVLRRIHR